VGHRRAAPRAAPRRRRRVAPAGARARRDAVPGRRRGDAYEATKQWLDTIGLAYDELYCSTDKVTHAIEIGIELLIDDKPADLLRALDAGMNAATLMHPWNADICEEEDIVCAADWPALGRALAPLLGAVS
jgi:uncharacterized protein